ncbi:WapI family immunity protein [Streptomyces sp. NPDC005046]
MTSSGHVLSDQASSAELRPLRYEFATVRGKRYDDNWLVVGGTVATPEGTWSFTDPSLLTHEARQVADWLRAVAAGTVTVTRPDAEGYFSPDTWFDEPVLAFSLADRSEVGAVIRLHLSWRRHPHGSKVRTGSVSTSTSWRYAWTELRCFTRPTSGISPWPPSRPDRHRSHRAPKVSGLGRSTLGAANEATSEDRADPLPGGPGAVHASTAPAGADCAPRSARQWAERSIMIQYR